MLKKRNADQRGKENPERKRFLIGFVLLTLIWTRSANHLYLYTRSDWHFLTIPVFPLIAWTVGLTTLWIIYGMAMKTFKIHKRFSFMIGYGIYLPALVGIETIGYHWFNIRLVSHYKGLPFFDCLHVPGWMKMVYFSKGGPVFFCSPFSRDVSFSSARKEV